jgi:hypothetical protein
VENVLGSAYLIPTVALLRTEEELSSFSFKARTVVKPTHSSGQIIVLRNPEDAVRVNREQVASWLRFDYYNVSRERNYYRLQKAVLVEELVFGFEDPVDCKIFCVFGEPKLIQVDLARFSAHRRKFFDVEGNPLGFSLEYPMPEEDVNLPKNLSHMLSAARQLSRYFDFVRVDFYSDGSEFKVGELTHCPGSASESFLPRQGELTASRILFQ